MFTVLLVLQVLMGMVIIGLVLLQQGKGADMGAAFGAGASGTVFGAAGGGSFFTRATAVLAALFFANSILLSSPLVLQAPDASVSVTQSVPAPTPAPASAAQESDVPVIEEDAVMEGAKVAPSDVPEVAEPAKPVEATQPAEQAAQPAKVDEGKQAEQAPQPAKAGEGKKPAQAPPPAKADKAPADTKPE